MAEERIELTVLKETFPDAIQDVSEFRGGLMVIIPPERNVEILSFLKEDDRISYDYLVDITAVDYLSYPDPMPGRFAVVYQLYSFKYNRRMGLKAFVSPGDMSIRTLSGVWKAANWLEREVFDMFGISFAGHPDLRRILMPDDYGSHPLRKDYPLKGKGEREDFKILK